MDIKPALTPEEWTNKYLNRYDVDSVEGTFPDGSKSERGWTVSDTMGQIFIGVSERGPPCMIGLVSTVHHPLAAFCLHGQPFGFTREDAACHRGYASALRKEGGPTSAIESWHASMADRIEALLPPDEE